MKKTIFLLFLTLVCVQSFAQKFGYIDSEFITSKMPEYKKAQEDMDKYSEKWVADIQVKYSELEKMRQQFQQEEILLTAEMKRERQKNIDDKEAELKELNNKVKKYLDRYAKMKNIDFVLNYQEGIPIVLYGNNAFNVTSEVLKGLNEEYQQEKKK
jgi:Skp family chaperone for outer membrane proteins